MDRSFVSLSPQSDCELLKAKSLLSLLQRRLLHNCSVLHSVLDAGIKQLRNNTQFLLSGCKPALGGTPLSIQLTSAEWRTIKVCPNVDKTAWRSGWFVLERDWVWTVNFYKMFISISLTAKWRRWFLPSRFAGMMIRSIYHVITERGSKVLAKSQCIYPCLKIGNKFHLASILSSTFPMYFYLLCHLNFPQISNVGRAGRSLRWVARARDAKSRTNRAVDGKARLDPEISWPPEPCSYHHSCARLSETVSSTIWGGLLTVNR